MMIPKNTIDVDQLIQEISVKSWAEKPYIQTPSYGSNPMEIASNARSKADIEFIVEIVSNMMRDHAYKMQECIANSRIPNDINLGVLQKAIESDNPAVKDQLEKLKLVVCLAHGEE